MRDRKIKANRELVSQVFFLRENERKKNGKNGVSCLVTYCGFTFKIEEIVFCV